MHWPGTWGLPHSRTPSQSTSDPALCWNVNSIYIKIGIVHHQKLNHLNCYQNHKISVGVVVVKEFCLRFLFFAFYGYSGDIWKSLEIWEKLCRFKIWYYFNGLLWSNFKRWCNLIQEDLERFLFHLKKQWISNYFHCVSEREGKGSTWRWLGSFVWVVKQIQLGTEREKSTAKIEQYVWIYPKDGEKSTQKKSIYSLNNEMRKYESFALNKEISSLR